MKCSIFLLLTLGAISAHAFMGLTGQRLGHAATGLLTLFVGTANIGNLDNTGTTARFAQPQGLGFDSSGNIWVADLYAETIRMIDTNQNVTTIAGTRDQIYPAGIDGAKAVARFYAPWSVIYNSALGSMVVADASTNTIRKVSASGSVTTFAGQLNTSGATNGTGTGATFSYPTSIAVDASGNMYVTDAVNNLIRKITTAGAVTTFAGSGSAGSANGTGTAASFTYPSNIVIDSTATNLYVVDEANQLIRKIGVSSAAVSTLAGTAGTTGSANGTGTAATFNYPAGLAIDSANVLYVADSGNQLIRKITTPGAVVTTLAGSGSLGSANGTGTAASFNSPNGLLADSSGNLFVADGNNALIRKIVISSKVVTTYAGSLAPSGVTNATGPAASFFTIFGMTFDGAGNLALVDTDNAVIRKATTGAVVTTLAGSAQNPGYTNGTGTAAQFNSPEGIVYDPTSGAYYVSDSGNYRIRKVTTAGAVTAYAGSGTNNLAAGSLTSGSFGVLGQLAVGASSTLYAVDTYSCAVVKVTTSAISILAGNSGNCGYTNATGTAAKFLLPRGVAVDSSGNVFVADTNNHAIRKVTSAGVVTTFAGSGTGVVGFVDGTTTAARFNGPMNLAIDAANNIYVADSGNNAVRKITSAGVVTTVVGNGAPATLLGVLPGSLYFPTAVALNGGYLYIATFGGIFKTLAP